MWDSKWTDIINDVEEQTLGQKSVLGFGPFLLSLDLQYINLFGNLWRLLSVVKVQNETKMVNYVQTRRDKRCAVGQQNVRETSFDLAVYLVGGDVFGALVPDSRSGLGFWLGLR